MNNNLDLSKVQSYSTALSSKLCNGYFSGDGVISGEEILQFSPVQQINLYIIKGLFEQWKDEFQKLESPYFNYQSEEVKEALSSFMNTLSKNIAVAKKDFLPLTQKAIYDTLLICISPEHYFEGEFLDEKIYSKESLHEKLKYTKIRPALLENFDSYLLSLNTSKISGSELKSFMSSVSSFTSEDEEAAQQLLDHVSALLQFEVKDFILPSFSPEAIAANKPFGEVKTAPEVTAKAIEKTKEVIQTKNTDQQLTINDSLKANPETSIADRFSKTKIEDLKSSIPLNLKFLFINILFDGNSVDYAHALSQVEESESFDKATQLLNTNFGSKYNWTLHQEEKDEFLKIIERKFY